MKSKIKNLKLIASLIVAILVCFNVYIHRAELNIKNDPNDNVFQFALVDEAKNIWKDIFSGKLSPLYLFDSHNGRWNEGFALNNYYAHLPQAVIALVSLIVPISSYDLFNLIKFLFLILLPVSYFVSARILKFSWIYAAILAIFSQLIFTDGLYGVDITSFLWRGWGLSAQLMALFFLPLAFAYTVRYLEEGRGLGKAVFFNFLMAQCHSGIFLMIGLGYPIILIFNFQFSIFNKLLNTNCKFLKRFFIFIFWLFFSLSYFLVPFFLQGSWRNFSYWDSLWKFNSWGSSFAITHFFNGDLFDFSRLPVITYLAAFGIFSAAASKNKLLKAMSTLFVMYFILFFGRTTLGGLIDIIPGLKEFHLHRFIVPVQFIGLYLAAYQLESVGESLINLFKKHYPQALTLLYLTLGVLMIIAFLYLEKPILNYVRENRLWITNSNKIYDSASGPFLRILGKIREINKNNSRVYAGQTGRWGRGFKVGESPLYMALSRAGVAVVGYPPESWSPNAEYDQFFDETSIDLYNLYNVGFIVAPESFKPPSFAKLVTQEGNYYLYEVKSEGYFTSGTSRIKFVGDKTKFFNIARLWQGSKYMPLKEFPTIDLESRLPDLFRNINLHDLNNYTESGKKFNLWTVNPFSYRLEEKKEVRLTKINEGILPQGYKGQFTLNKDCSNCIAVLKQTYHPNWEVKITYQDKTTNVRAFPVFPYYIGIPINKAGSYSIEAVYKPGRVKVAFLLLELVVFGGLGLISLSIGFGSRGRPPLED